MTDNNIEKKDQEPPNYKSTQLVLQVNITDTDTPILEDIPENVSIEDVIPNTDGTVENSYMVYPNNIGNNNGSYELKIKNLKQIQQYDQMNKVVTVGDMTDESGNTMFIKLEHTFGNDHSIIKIIGEKPIIWEHNELYIEPEKTNHFDFIFMVLCPFLVLMLILGLRKKYKKKE